MRRIVPLLFILHFSFFIVPAHAQWAQTNGPYGGYVHSFLISDGYLFAGTEGGGVFRTSDDGANWTAVNNGLGNYVVYSIGAKGNDLFAGTQGGVYRSTDDGMNWSFSGNGLTNPYVHAFAVSDTILIAGTEHGLFYTTDEGDNWIHANTFTNNFIYSLGVCGGIVYAGIYAGVLDSRDNGMNWSYTSLTHTVYDFTVHGNNIYAGITNGLYISNDGGISWSSAQLADQTVYAIAATDSDIFAGTYAGGIFHSTNNGASWTAINKGLPSYGVLALMFKDSAIFAGTFTGGIGKSTNNGANWFTANNGLSAIAINAIEINGDNYLAATQYGMFLSTDLGEDCNLMQNGMAGTSVLSMAMQGNIMYAGTNGTGVFRSTDSGLNWYNKLQSYTVTALAMNDNDIFAMTESGIYISTDSGTSWYLINNWLASQSVMISHNGILLTGGAQAGVYTSTDNGTNWNLSESGLLDSSSGGLYSVFALAANGNNIYAGTDLGVVRSTDNGIHWKPTGLGITINGLLTYGSDLFAATDSGVYYSADSGAHWRMKNNGLTNLNVTTFASGDSTIFAGTTSNLWKQDVAALTDVNEKLNDLPSQFSLSQNYPNPFSGTTNVEFRIPNEEQVTLNVYDMLGEKVATLAHGTMSAGTHSVQLSGEGLQNGVYFYRLTAGKDIKTGKMSVIH